MKESVTPERIDGYHLPGLAAPRVTSWSFGGGVVPAIELRAPLLNPALIGRLVDNLLEAREQHLQARPVLEIVRAIGAVAERLLDTHDPLRRKAVLALRGVTGMSAPMAELILDGMATDWREPALARLLEVEFGSPAALDTFVPRAGSAARTRVYGPELTVHVFSGNVPGVSVTSMIRSLLLKSAALGKTAAGEPVLAPLFARALAEQDPGIGACLAVTYWAGGDESLEAAALARADAVIAYGGSEAVESLRRRVPEGARFIGYGHRASFGVIAREALHSAGAAELAHAAALAVATFDQQGCVSPHLFYVEEGGETTAREWAELLAAAMGALEETLPRGVLAPGESAAIRQARAEAEFGQLAGRGHELHASPATTAWTVIFDPEPGFTPSCLNRLVRVKSVATLDDIAEQVRPLSSVLQTVGVAGPDERIVRLAEQLGRFGASRISPIASMAWPPPQWHHDGRPPLADLARWCDLG